MLPETDIEGAQVLIRKAKVFINELLRQSRNSNLEMQTQFTSWGNGDDMPGILSRVGL